MMLFDASTKVIGFLRAGYRTGAPTTGYVSLLALAPRRLCDDEIAEMAQQLASQKGTLIGDTDIGVMITKIAADVPCPADIDRVKRHLATVGLATS